MDTGSWAEAYDKLVKGEIDLLPSFTIRRNGRKGILFVRQPMCSIYTTLNVRLDDERDVVKRWDFWLFRKRLPHDAWLEGNRDEHFTGFM